MCSVETVDHAMDSDEAQSHRPLTLPCSEERCRVVNHGPIHGYSMDWSVLMKVTCVNQYRTILWAVGIKNIMYSFYLLPCKTQDILLSIFRFAYAFYNQPSVSKMHKKHRIGHWISDIFLSFTSSLLSVWQHIPILCRIVLFFFWVLVELKCQLLGISSSPE